MDKHLDIGRKPAIALKCGHWEAELRGDAGGAIAALRHKGIDILRPMRAASSNPLDAACFPLVPYCNRVCGGKFTWNGRAISLPRNSPPDRSSLHGDGWQNAWQSLQSGDAEARLQYVYDGSAYWPWSYCAEQIVTLDPSGLTLELNVSNTSGQAMPVGLGLHPYFRRDDHSRLRFACSGVAMVDDDLIPSGEIADAGHFASWSEGAQLPQSLVDHCHLGWGGEVTIADSLGAVRMQAMGAANVHIYAPPGADFFCCEPVSHTPDALNQDKQAMSLLPPGSAASLSMRIEAE